MLATRLFDELRDEHGLSNRERLLLQTAALLHDIGIYVSLRAHHKHSQYLLAASQIFGLSDEETAIVSNIARYHRRGTPQESHLPYIALDRHDRARSSTSWPRSCAWPMRSTPSISRRCATSVSCAARRPGCWSSTGTGDITMEQMAATARADMFVEVFGRQLVVRPAGVIA